MESIGLIFAMLIAVLFSGVVVRVLPFAVPLPIVQIVFGFLLAGVFQDGITLHSDVFFLLFLPPLLFLDAWRIPKDALRRDGFGVFHLAFGLVIITVFGLGYIIHWMIPVVPLAVACALAAIVSPTDAVAVSGIAKRLGIPPRIMAILEGEALFNDASGLVAFRMAVLAAMTGTFSWYSASALLLWVSLGGLAAGAVVTWLLSFFRKKFTNKYGEELGSEVLLSLLTPFAAYVVAEQIGASGILSAVAAGLTMSYLELSGRISPLTRMRRTAVWDTIQFTLNGIMFVLLGEQLPDIFKGAVEVVEQTGHSSPWWLIVYALVICIVLAVFRFTWVALSIYVSRLFRKTALLPENRVTLREVLILSIGGVRGAVTLAGVLTLPLLLPNHLTFPARDLAIFLAACVIIISLVMASVGLPFLLKGMQPERRANTSLGEQKRYAIRQAAQALTQELQKVIQKIDKVEPHLGQVFYDELSHRLLIEFENSFGVTDETNTSFDQQYLAEKKLRLVIISSARRTVYKLARDREISDEVAREIVKQLDFDEVRFNH